MKLTDTKDLATLITQAAKVRQKLNLQSDVFKAESGDDEFNKYDSMSIFFEQVEIALDELKEEIEDLDWELPNGD